MLTSALGMAGGKASAMFFGFAFWLLAARVASPDQVGLAAGATSTIMLIVLLASSGLAAATVIGVAADPDRRHELIDTALTLAAVAALVISGFALGLALWFLDELDAVARNPWFALTFVAMSILGSLGVLMDQVSMTDRRGHDVWIRNAANGVVTILPLGLVAIGLIRPSGFMLFLAWVIGSATAIVIGVGQLDRMLPGTRRRPKLASNSLRRLARSGPSNQILTTTERAPGLILPIVVTEVLSPAENAFWYATWMMSWGVAVIPLSLGTALFAEICNDPESARAKAMRAIRSSLAVGLPVAGAVVLAAPALLALLGDRYSDAGAWPLRLLVLGVVPLTFIYTYFAVARATGHIGEAIATAIVGGVAGCVGASIAGARAGLVAMAAGWILIQFITGAFAAYRLSALVRRPPAATAVPGTTVAVRA